MSISLDIPRPMSLMFLIAAFRRRRSLGLNSDRDTEVEDPDQETEVDDFAEVDDYEEYEDEGYDYNSHPPKHPRKWIGFPKLGCALTSILLPFVIVLSTFLYVLWSHAQTQNYLDINGITRVAQVRVDPTPRYRHHMNVNLMPDDNNGHEYFDPNCSTTCTLSGDNLLLQGVVITYPAWQGAIGLHPKFKLTILMGHFIDPAIARVNTPDAKNINGGNDGYFELAQEQGLLAFLGVAAAYTNTVTVPADSHTYNVYMSQNGLFIKTAD